MLGKRSHRGKIVAALLVLLAWIGLVAGYDRWRHQPKFILAIEPVGEGRAIVCARDRNDRWASATSVGLFDPRAGWVWTRRLPPDPIDDWMNDGHVAVMTRVSAREGLLVHDGRAFVRVPGDELWFKGVVSAFAIEDGKPLWRTTLDDLGSGDFYFDITAAGTEILVGAGKGIAALDAATGALLWRSPLDDQDRSRVSLATGVMTGDNDRQTWTTDLKTGERQMQPTDGRACLVDGQLLYFERSDEWVRLMAKRIDTGETGVAVAELGFPGADARPSLWGCGRYGDHLLLMIGFSLDAPSAVLEVDLAAGREVAFTQLRSMVGPTFTDAAMQSRLASAFPDNAPWTGALPRYVPILMVLHEGDAPSLAIIDLQQRRELRRGPPAANLDHALFMRHGDSFTISARDDLGMHTLARLDGQTGTITGAACTTSNLAPMKPLDRHGDELWLHTDELGLPIALLRGNELSPTFERKLHVEECRTRTSAAWLGP